MKKSKFTEDGMDTSRVLFDKMGAPPSRRKIAAWGDDYKRESAPQLPRPRDSEGVHPMRLEDVTSDRTPAQTCLKFGPTSA